MGEYTCPLSGDSGSDQNYGTGYGKNQNGGVRCRKNQNGGARCRNNQNGGTGYQKNQKGGARYGNNQNYGARYRNNQNCGTRCPKGRRAIFPLRVIEFDGGMCYSPEQFGAMADYRKLHVWQKADGLATAIYEIANAVRKSGHRDLAEQLKRSANSIVSNIAEGSGHTSRKDFSRFLQYSNASCCELESQVSIARNVGAIPHQRSEKVFDDIAVIRKMLAGLTKKLKA